MQRMRELFSGVPKTKRDRRLLMVMQAFIDDSQADGQVLVLAGYLANFERWENFSIEWQQLLDGPPRWQRFKMVEVATIPRDTARWERAAAFYRTVETHAQAFVAVAVELEPLARAARDAGIPPGKLTNAYLFAHRAICEATLQYQREMGINEPVDFIFDKLGANERIIREGWEVFAASRPPELADLVGREPRFETDDEFLPLQAADMLAWHAREHWLKHRSLTSDQLLLSWRPKNNPQGYRFNLGYPDLLEWFRGARVRAVEVGHIPRVTLTVTFSSNLSDYKRKPPERRERRDGEG
jgi:hypothetical protein